MSLNVVTTERVIAYIDGFNLYFGLKDSRWQRYYWLNLEKFVTGLLSPGDILESVKYFTARVSSPPDKYRRQKEYLEALTVTPCQVFFGKYQPQTYFCQNCYRETQIPNEKMTDVNIAVEMMSDAFQNRFEAALLISGDSDLTPPVKAVLGLFPQKRVVVAFPPKRHSKDLEKVASSHRVIARTVFRDSQLPEEIKKPDGYVLKRPVNWR